MPMLHLHDIKTNGMTLKQMALGINSQFRWGLEVQILDFIIINHSQIAIPPPSTSLQFLGFQMGNLLMLCLQTVLYLPHICQMQCLWRIPVFLTSNLLKTIFPWKGAKMDCLEIYLCTCKYKSTPKDQTGSSLGHLWDRKFYRDSLEFLTSMIRNSWGLTPCNLQAPWIYWKKFHL